MKLTIAYQEEYSRVQLLLRVAFGVVYIALPHAIPLMVLAVVSLMLMPAAWVAVLLTREYPRALFDFEVALLRWQMRVNARLNNLTDGYPAFGLKAKDERVSVEIPYPEQLSRSHLLLKLCFGWLFCALPHIVVLIPRGIVTVLLMTLAFFTVLLMGRYPESWHRFNVGTMRHVLRVRLYLGGMTDTYPAFR
ncbi:MAG: DUF4389 domain-containing protein [Flavobacteriales bacterium]|nr:DUF4389 domain-containing protein [Flavobacteriales bacterium]